MERSTSEIYSGHRYLDDKGLPDYERIFNIIESPLRRHLDDWLLKYLDNQPEIVREYRPLTQHLKECEECRQKTEPEKGEKQIDLPLNPE